MTIIYKSQDMLNIHSNKTIQYWNKNKCVNQWNKIEDSNMTTHNLCYLQFEKNAKKKKTLLKRKCLYKMVLEKLRVQLHKTLLQMNQRYKCES